MELTAAFGLDKIVIMPSYGALIGVYPEKSISLELSENDKNLCSAEFLYQKLQAWTNKASVDITKISIFEYFVTVTKNTFLRVQNGLGNVTNFELLAASQLSLINLDPDLKLVPIFYGCDAYADAAFILVRLISAQIKV